MSLTYSPAVHRNVDLTGAEPRDFRVALEGLLVREGLLPGSPALVLTGTAGWAYTIAGPAWWATRRAAGQGLHVWGNDGAITVGQSVAGEDAQGDTVPSAPASGLERIDIAWVMQPSNGEGSDTSSIPIAGVTVGEAAAVAIPPSIPTGATEVGRNTMTSDATSTSSAGNSIEQTMPWAAAAGGMVHCRTQAELDVVEALGSADNPILAELGGSVFVCSGGDPAVVGDRRLGGWYLASEVLLGVGPAWTDLGAVTATSRGGVCTVEYDISLYNGASGLDRTAGVRVTLDGVAMTDGVFSGVLVPLTGAPRVPRFATAFSTPAAGSHTWVLQAQASASTSVYAGSARMTVREA